MSKRVKLIFQVFATLVFLGLLVPFWFYLRNNDIRVQNTLIRTAREDYFRREFLSAMKSYERLIDSLEFDDDAARMNYGNSAFMSSSILRNGFYASSRSNSPVVPDSVLKQLAAKSQDTYNLVSASANKKLASLAYNQLGYSLIKSEFTETGTDSVLYQALFHFRQALKSDPGNDSARYNYELIKKIMGFPETTMASTNALIAEQRYVEAAELLEQNMARDIRLRKQGEFLKRLKAVAGIDTTFTKK